MIARRRYDVCAAVVSDLAFDARVWKEARSLADAGYAVRLVGCRYELPAKTRSSTEHGVDVLEVSLGSRAGGVSSVERAGTLLRLWLEVLRTPASVYHAHNIHVGPAAWTAARLRGAKLVYDAHELYGEPMGSGRLGRYSAALGRVAEGFMVRRADRVITTNASRVARLRERYGDVRIDILANVPHLVEDVEPLDPGFPNAGARTLLYQGGIYARSRAFRETVQALRLLDDDVHLVVLGFGREEEIALVRRWAEEEGVSDRVRFLPPRPFEELVRTAAAASVGLVPVKPDNLNNLLGDTNKLFEYLMAGIPVVASDLPEIRRVVETGEPHVGEIFDPSRPESIAEAVQRVLGDPVEYERRREEARRLAVEQFNWGIEERTLLSMYEEVARR